MTGMYQTTTGTHHMRSKLKKPPEMFTQHLQRAARPAAPLDHVGRDVLGRQAQGEHHDDGAQAKA